MGPFARSCLAQSTLWCKVHRMWTDASTKTNPRSELARLDELGQVTRELAEAGYGKQDVLRGLSWLPTSAVAAIGAAIWPLSHSWAYVVASLLPVAWLVGPMLFERRYLEIGRVEPFTYVAPPGPGLRKAGRIFATTTWLAGGAGLAFGWALLGAIPGLPHGLAPSVLLVTFVVSGILGWRTPTLWRWMAPSLLYGWLISMGLRLGDGEGAPSVLLGMLCMLALAVFWGLADHRHFLHLERRLANLRERE